MPVTHVGQESHDGGAAVVDNEIELTGERAESVIGNNIPCTMDLELITGPEEEPTPFARIVLRLPGGAAMHLNARIATDDYSITAYAGGEALAPVLDMRSDDEAERGIIVSAARAAVEALRGSPFISVQEFPALDGDTLSRTFGSCPKCFAIIPVPKSGVLEGELCHACGSIA